MNQNKINDVLYDILPQIIDKNYGEGLVIIQKNWHLITDQQIAEESKPWAIRSVDNNETFTLYVKAGDSGASFWIHHKSMQIIDEISKHLNNKIIKEIKVIR